MPPTTTPKRTRAFTNTSGERVTKFTDGTETRVPATPAVPTSPAPLTTPTTDIPVAAIENNTQPIVLPEPQLDPTAAIADATAGAETILSANVAEEQRALEATQTPVSESERRVREAVGLIKAGGTEEERLRQEQGVDEKTRVANRFAARSKQLADEIQLFNIDTGNQSYSQMLDASKRDVTKGTFNAQDSRFRLERALEANSKASELIGLRAAYEVASGEVKLATDSISRAMDTYYKVAELDLQMEQTFLQRNWSQMDDAQKNLATAKQKEIDFKVQEIQDAKVDVSTAVATGVATDTEVQEMNALSGNPKAQREYAQKIIARASRAEIARQEAQVAASRSAASWSQRASAYELAMNGDPTALEFLGFDPRESSMTLQDSFNYINETLEDDRIIANLDKALESDAAIDASSGISQSAIGTASARYGGPALLAGGAAGSVVPVVGTLLGSFGGYVTGTVVGTVQIANQKKDLLGALSALSNTAAFNKMREYKEQGLTFGQLTEAERIAIGKSSADLFAALDVDPDGTVTGINVSPSRFKELVTAYKTDTELKKAQKAQIYSGLNTADEDLINNLP